MLSKVATIEAMCTNGPSLPRGKPEPRVQVSPTILAMSVRNVRYSLSTTPRRIVFISGIPDPIAFRGERYWVRLRGNKKVERERETSE